MQSVRNFMRTIGVPNPELGIISAQEAEEQLEYALLAGDYKLHTALTLGAVRDKSNEEVGYKVLYVLVKDEEPAPAEEPKAKPAKATKAKKAKKS